MPVGGVAGGGRATVPGGTRHTQGRRRLALGRRSVYSGAAWEAIFALYLASL